MMVRDFQRVIGDECLVQMPEMIGRQPDAVIACVGGGSNAMGIFYPVHRARGRAPDRRRGRGPGPGQRQARGVAAAPARPACCTATAPTCCRTTNGQITETHSISAGLDYPGVGPEHAYLKDIGRAEYVGITDDEALAAFHRLCRTEGIIPALESSHAVAYAMKLAPTMRADQHLLVNLSGRGDKDIGTVADLSGAEFFCRPSCTRPGGEGRSHEPHRSHLRRAGRAQGRKALIPYITAGDPYAEATVEIMLAMAEAGADIIELGVPFSDPMADGPVIQKASERALAKGIGMAQVLAIVRGFRARNADHAGGADGLRQPDRALRHRRASSPTPRRPASTACWWSTTRPRSAEAFAARLEGRGAGPDLPARAHLDRAAHAATSAASPAATCTTCR